MTKQISTLCRRSAQPAALVLLLGAIAIGCVKQVKLEPIDPWIGSRSEFREQVKVLAIIGVALPDGLPDPAPIENQFDELIDKQLRRAGYSIVRPQSYAAAWEKAVRDVGGLEDADGKRDDHQVTKAAFLTMNALQAEFRVNAVVIPAVNVVEARFAGGRARWDGTTQRINTANTRQSFLQGAPDGVVGALSLTVSIYDVGGKALYQNAGGIEVLNKLQGSEFVLVPRQELFQDPEKLERAVRIALEPLGRR